MQGGRVERGPQNLGRIDLVRGNSGEALVYFAPEAPHRVFFIAPQLEPILAHLSDVSQRALANRINFTRLEKPPRANGTSEYAVWEKPYVLDFISDELGVAAQQWADLTAQGIGVDQATAQVSEGLTVEGMRGRFGEYVANNKSKVLPDTFIQPQA